MLFWLMIHLKWSAFVWIRWTRSWYPSSDILSLGNQNCRAGSNGGIRSLLQYRLVEDNRLPLHNYSYRYHRLPRGCDWSSVLWKTFHLASRYHCPTGRGGQNYCLCSQYPSPDLHSPCPNVHSGARHTRAGSSYPVSSASPASLHNRRMWCSLYRLVRVWW